MAASTVVSGVMERVSFVQKLPMIIKATSDDDTPTAGYLYQEISDLTFVSNSYCSSVLDVLVDRLDKSSHHVKFKVLRVMKHVVENGSEEFRSGLLRRSSGIQLATKFSGLPDPLHGNAPYIAVRSAAKGLSEILFDTEQSRNEETSSPRKMALSGGQGLSRSGSSMQGFGNTVAPVNKQKSLTETVKGGFQHLVDSFRESTTPPAYLRVDSDYKPLGGSDTDTLASAVFSLTSGKKKGHHASDSSDRKGEYTPVAVDDSVVPSARSYQPGNKDLNRVTAGYKQGKPAGGWEDSSRGRGSNASNSDEQHSGDSTELSERLESVSVEDLSLETKLVEDFVSATNGKPTPSRDALTQFVKQCSTLNCEKVTDLLVLELQSASDSVHIRCLCVLEALLREDIVSADHLYGILPHTLTTLQVHSTDRLVQSKASKILRQLERTHEEASIAKSSTPQPDYTLSSMTDPITDIQQTVIASDYQSENLDSQMITTLPVHESLVTTFLQDRTTPSALDDTPINLQSIPSQKPKSLFSGMDIGSPSVQKTSERTLVLDEAMAGSKSSGSFVENNLRVRPDQTQLLDNLLDLSSTDQPILALNEEQCPNLEIDPLPSGDMYHLPVRFHATTHQSQMGGSGNESGIAVELSNNGNTTSIETRLQANTGSNTNVELDNSKPSTTPRKPDSIMSRQANLDDLLAATGITVSTGNIGKARPVPSKEPSPKLGTSNPVMSGTPIVNADQISRLYPQLAGVSLSGSTAIPLKLGERPPDGKFAFMVAKDDGGRENSKRAGSFDFVKDAMMTSKK